MTENPAQSNPCTNFQSSVHPTKQSPMNPALKDLMSECANTVGQINPQQSNAPYGNTYNSNWRNHPNLAWRPNPPTYVPPGAKPQFGTPSQSQQPPSSSPVEQAILNLCKVVGNFVEEQKGINVQLAQRIDTVENTLNKRIDGLESNLNQKIDNLQYSITKINKLLEVQVMKIKAQRIRDARAFTTYIGNSILIMENSDLGGCETLETPNIFLFPSVLSLLLF